MPDKLEYVFAEIDGEAPNKVQLMRTIKAEHGYYGSIELTKKDLRKFKENFDKDKRRVELAVDYSHMSHLEAAGWIKGVELQNNDSELWINVEWTKEAKQKIEDRQYRYLSADFSMKYVDDETGELVGQMLHGAGLTNRPFIRGMKAILSEFNNVELNEIQISKIRDVIHGDVKLTEEKEDKMNLDEILEKAKELSKEDQVKLAEGLGVSKSSDDGKKLSEVEAKVKTLEEENKSLSEKLESTEKGKKEAEKKAKFDLMLAEGKAVEAQREAFMSDDVAKFAELREDVNLNEKGADSDEGTEGEPKTAEEAAAKLSEIADKIVEDEGISFDEALSKAVRENEKLYELSEKQAA